MPGEICEYNSTNMICGEVVPREVEEELDQIVFHGHSNILSLHRNTIELTKYSEISKRADCVIGLKASKSCEDLTSRLKDRIRLGCWMRFELRLGGHSFTFEGRGSPKLDLTDRRELVLRRSDYPSPRTAALHCSHSACDIPRNLVSELQDPEAEGLLIIRSLPKKKEQTIVWSLP